MPEYLFRSSLSLVVNIFMLLLSYSRLLSYKMAALSPRYHMYALNGKLSGSEQSYHTVELFLDFVCPYSAKLWKTLYNNQIFEQNQRVQFIFRHQIQPWHTQSTLVHTVAMAVAQHKPDKLKETMNTLFQQQTEFYDDKVEKLTQV